MTPRLVKLTAAADRYDISPRTIRRHIAQGRIRGYRLGDRLIRVSLEDVEALARPIPTADADAPPAA